VSDVDDTFTIILQYQDAQSNLTVTVKTAVVSHVKDQLKYYFRGTEGSYMKVIPRYFIRTNLSFPHRLPQIVSRASFFTSLGVARFADPLFGNTKNSTANAPRRTTQLPPPESPPQRPTAARTPAYGAP
jgi:hypothetical protein